MRNPLLPELPRIVRAVLSKDGPLPALLSRFRESEEQLEYARRISELLIKPDGDVVNDGPATVLLEAGTGIGKSLGYLVPLVAYSAITGKRVAVASYTLELLHQLEEAAELARTALGESGLLTKTSVKEVTHALRLGMPEFIAPSRVDEMLALGHWTDPEREILESLKKHSEKGDGLFRTWGGELPGGMTRDAVALTPNCPKEDRAIYDAHAIRAQSVRLVICSHAALIIQAIGRNNMIGGFTPYDGAQQGISPDALVIDEADRIPGMAETVTSVRVPIRSLQRALDADGAPPRILTAVMELGDYIVKKLDGERREYLTPASNPRLRTELIAMLDQTIKIVSAFVKKIPAAKESDSRVYLGEMKRLLANMSGKEAIYELPFIETSPVKTYPSLGLANSNPGAVLNALWRFERLPIQRLVVTSATLSMGTEASIKQYGNRLGLFKSMTKRIDEDLGGAIHPKKFGKLGLVFADPTIPYPFMGSVEDDEGDYPPNPEWLAYVAKMVGAARSEGGRTLVLCGSFREAELLNAELAKRHIVAVNQQRGPEGRRRAQEEFLSKGNSVWASPSVWEGLDLPGAIQQLVICRIPFRPVDGGSAGAKKQVLISQGKTDDEAARIVRTEASSDAFRKFVQGVGRPIRSPSDSATLWIADPRVPLPEPLMDAYLDSGGSFTLRHQHLFLKAIPSRFRTEKCLERARVLFTSGETACRMTDFA